MVTPDGMPLVWLSRLAGHRAGGAGVRPDLMLACCERSLLSGAIRHFFYGGADGVPERLIERLAGAVPGTGGRRHRIRRRSGP